MRSGWPRAQAALVAPALWPVSVEAAAYPALTAPARAGYEMLPAKPPFPTPWYLPFQPAAGIQISSLMSESLAGLTSAITRQKAGTSLNAAMPAAPPAGANAPAATDCALVIEVSGSLRALKLSHEAGFSAA